MQKVAIFIQHSCIVTKLTWEYFDSLNVALLNAKNRNVAIKNLISLNVHENLRGFFLLTHLLDWPTISNLVKVCTLWISWRKSWILCVNWVIRKNSLSKHHYTKSAHSFGESQNVLVMGVPFEHFSSSKPTTQYATNTGALFLSTLYEKTSWKNSIKILQNSFLDMWFL